MENVQEFRVDSNTYPAELGTGTGGQISIITKSGGNAFHGSLFEYFRNDKLDARNLFDGANPSILRLNQFGGSIGGPIVKNKLFFFAGTEVLKQRTRSPFVEATPSAVVRALPDCIGPTTAAVVSELSLRRLTQTIENVWKPALLSWRQPRNYRLCLARECLFASGLNCMSD